MTKPQSLVLAIDIGTSSVRSAFFDEHGARLAKTATSREYAVEYRADGAAELHPQKLSRAVRLCLAQTLQTRRDARAIRDVPIAAIAGSGFWHSLLGLGARRRPITPIYTWADTRSADDAQRLRERFDERAVHSRTGCMLRASFWPAKLAWLARTQRQLFRRVAFWVSPADWLFAELFGTTSCSASMASGTGLYNHERRGWDVELCAALHLRELQLAAICDVAESEPPTELRGATIFCALGDGAASNLGSGADRPGFFAVNIGTSAAVRVVETGATGRVPFGLFRYAVDHERVVLGGAVSNAGNLRRWCLRELRVSDAQASRLTRRDRAKLSETALDVLPFWAGERAPTWPENIHGTIAGLTPATTALDIERAAICAVFYRLGAILELTEQATGRAQAVIVSGGILRSADSLPVLADVFGRDLRVATEMEASLRGAAVYALEKIGTPPARLRLGKIIKHDRRLAAKHRARRVRQEALERALTALH